MDAGNWPSTSCLTPDARHPHERPHGSVMLVVAATHPVFSQALGQPGSAVKGGMDDQAGARLNDWTVALWVPQDVPPGLMERAVEVAFLGARDRDRGWPSGAPGFTTRQR